MWWTIFTAADLYIGLIVIDAMAPSIPAEKLGRLRVARKVILALLVVSAIVLLLQIARRQAWMPSLTGRTAVAIIEAGGGNSSTGRAPDCGSDGCGFDSRFPPQVLQSSCGDGRLGRPSQSLP
jgi:hypothetical protein